MYIYTKHLLYTCHGASRFVLKPTRGTFQFFLYKIVHDGLFVFGHEFRETFGIGCVDIHDHLPHRVFIDIGRESGVTIYIRYFWDNYITCHFEGTREVFRFDMQYPEIWLRLWESFRVRI